MQPTYIVLVGDYASGHSAVNNLLNLEAKERLLDYLRALRKISPIVMSLGNHDISQNMETPLRKEFLTLEDEVDVHTVDRDVHYKVDDLNINFLGYMQPHELYSICDMNRKKQKGVLNDIKEYMPKSIEDGYYNVGLIHTPYVARDKFLLNNGSPTKLLDLILSGHHHGGLITWKLRNKIIKASEILKRIFPGHEEAIEKIKYIGLCENPFNHPLPFINPYAWGIHKFGGVDTIISKGVGNESASGPHRSDPRNQFVTQVDIKKL